MCFLVMKFNITITTNYIDIHHGYIHVVVHLIVNMCKLGMSL